MSDYVKACYLGTIALTARGCNDYKWTSSTVGKNIDPKRYIPFYEKLQLKVKKHFLPIENDSMVYYEDSRNLDKIIKPDSVDFIFSSPPYFDCLDYTAYYARIVYDILGYERIQIRSRLIQSFESYKKDMKRVLDKLYKVLKPGGNEIIYYEEYLSNNTQLEELYAAQKYYKLAVSLGYQQAKEKLDLVQRIILYSKLVQRIVLYLYSK